MLKDLGNNRLSRAACIPYIGFVLICCFLLLPTIAEAANRAYIDVGKTGQTEPYDTIYMGGEYEFRILIENDMAWHGMTLYYEIWSDDGTEWEWLHQPDGWGVLGLGHYPAFFTVVPGSRMDPIEDTFDGLLLVGYRSIDGISPDSVITCANRQFDPGLLPGDMQPMISIHFRATGPWSPGEIKQLCIRHINWPAGNDFLFFNSGFSFMPEVNTPICIPIKTVCGDANGDGAVNLGDVGFILCVIFYDCYWLDPWQLADANGDSGLGMGDAAYIINYIFYDGPAPVCPE